MTREANPFCDITHRATHNLHISKPPIQELSGVLKLRRRIRRHEELRSGIYARERSPFCIPAGINRRVPRQEPDLVREGGEFRDRGGDIGRLSDECQCLKSTCISFGSSQSREGL